MEKIQEINQHIKDGVEQWANIMLTADADEWACELDYTKEDLMNSLLIMNHIASNIGIKNGTIRDENHATILGIKLRALIIEITSIDPHAAINHKIDE